MKEIVVPSPITLRDVVTDAPGQTLTFLQWAVLAWFNDPRWGKSTARLVIVVQEFKKKPGEKMMIEDADYALLAEIVKDPQSPQQPPLTAMQLEPFKTTILSAGATKK